MVDFNSRSALLYRFNQKSMSTVKDRISLKFKSQGADGVLVHGAGQRGDYLTLELHQGTLVLHLNLGRHGSGFGPRNHCSNEYFMTDLDGTDLYCVILDFKQIRYTIQLEPFSLLCNDSIN